MEHQTKDLAIEAQQLSEAEREKIKKEREEKEVHLRNEGLAAAIELAALQATPLLSPTLAASLFPEQIAIISSIQAIYDNIAAFEEKGKKLASEFEAQKDITLSKISQSPVDRLQQLLGSPEASASLAAEMQIDRKELHKLKIEGDFIVMEGDEKKRLPYVNLENHIRQVVKEVNNIDAAITPLDVQN